jgi:hypothetical protein
VTYAERTTLVSDFSAELDGAFDLVAIVSGTGSDHPSTVDGEICAVCERAGSNPSSGCGSGIDSNEGQTGETGDCVERHLSEERNVDNKGG